MRFSFVFSGGRMRLDGQPTRADQRLYHLDLPHAVALTTAVPGTVEQTRVEIPAIDVLGVLRHIHGGSDTWLGSGARARLTGATIHPHSREQGRAVLDHLQRLLDDGQLTTEVAAPDALEGRRKLRWEATATDPDGKQVSKRFEHREDAEDWLRRRAFARAIGWPFIRTDQLLDNPTTNPTLDELLDLADLLTEPPSNLLAAPGR